ncbi:MAG TPA: hypothetical protein DCG06_02095, partial [Deltaproteobacteria bacterium]|nr:hypothetical protein [Deltaproteobacteria bacterium]
MPKRIHELAKEWNLQSKELLASLETLGISGKRSQSSLQEPEVERLALQLGRGPSAEPTVGTERVVGERMVTEKDGQGEVTSRESTVEARVRPNVIRRRRRRVEVGRKDTAPSDVGGSNDGSLIDFPDMGSSSDSSTGSAEPSGLIPDLPPSDVGIENFTTEPAPTTEAPAVDEVPAADTAATTKETASGTAAEASAETT